MVRLKDWRFWLLWLGLPGGIGLFLGVIARLFLPAEIPFLASLDLGFTGIVFGMSMRNSVLVAFLSVIVAA